MKKTNIIGLGIAAGAAVTGSIINAVKGMNKINKSIKSGKEKGIISMEQQLANNRDTMTAEEITNLEWKLNSFKGIKA